MRELSVFVDETGALEKRRKMLYKLFYFYNRCDMYHDTVVIDRKEKRMIK